MSSFEEDFRKSQFNLDDEFENTQSLRSARNLNPDHSLNPSHPFAWKDNEESSLTKAQFTNVGGSSLLMRAALNNHQNSKESITRTENIISQKNSNTTQEKEEDKENPILQALNYIWGTVIGDWNNEQDPIQILANVGVGLIPVADQVLDFRDFIAHLYYMVFKKDYKDPMRWLALGLTAIGAIPFVGSILKGLGKISIFSDGGKAIGKYAEPILEQIKEINPEWGDISKLKGAIDDNWEAGVATSKEAWMNLLANVKARIGGVPLPPGFVWGADKLTSAKEELLFTITEIENLSNSILDEGLDAIKSEIEIILDELNRVSKELLNKRELEKIDSIKKIEPEHRPVKSSEDSLIKNNIESKDLLNNPNRNHQLENVLIRDEKVPIIIDNNLTSNTVEVHYSKGENGLVDVNSIHIKAGPSATSTDIMLHGRTVGRLKSYSGLLGKVIKLKNQLLDLFFNIENPEIASKAWEAMLEVEKLEDIINYNMRQRSKRIDIRPEEFKAEIENLEVQLAEYRKTYESLDNSEGLGYIAARGKKTNYQEKVKEIEEALVKKIEKTGKNYLLGEEIIEILGLDPKSKADTLRMALSRLRKGISELDPSSKKTLYYNSKADAYSFSEKDVSLAPKIIKSRKEVVYKTENELSEIRINQLNAISDLIKSKDNKELSSFEIYKFLKTVENKFEINQEKINSGLQKISDGNNEKTLKINLEEIEELGEKANSKSITGEERKYIKRNIEAIIKEFSDAVEILKVEPDKYSFNQIDLEKLKKIEKQIKINSQIKPKRKREGLRELKRSNEDLRKEFSKELESGELKEDVFELICGWREVIEEWEKIDGNFNISEIIRKYFKFKFSNAKKELRANLRKKVVNIVKSKPVEERINTLNKFRGVLDNKDSRLRGELFTQFRRESLDENLLPGIQPISGNLTKTLEDLGDADKANQAAKEAGLKNPPRGKRYVDLGDHITKSKNRYVLVKDKEKYQIDDFIEIKEQVNESYPELGKYLVEDKGGVQAFQIEQAKIYSAHIMKCKERTIKTQNLLTKEGGEYDGVVYFFEIEKLDKIEAYKEGYVHVVFFDKKGKLQWSENRYQNN